MYVDAYWLDETDGEGIGGVVGGCAGECKGEGWDEFKMVRMRMGVMVRRVMGRISVRVMV